MKLHYKGKFDLNPESLPHGEHIPGAVPFQEPDDPGKLAKICNGISAVILILMAIPAAIRCWPYIPTRLLQISLGCLCSLLIVFPHELLHALCFKEDVYLYTNWKQGMLFVVGPETMSKGRFIFMSLLPNLVFGFLPYCIGLIFPHLIFLAVFGIMSAAMGSGDYCNVFHAATQMPKGARTYLYQFHSYWYLPN